MTADHRDLQDLVLGFEDLDDAERARALEHLAGCPDCRALREGLLARERLARASGALPGVGESRAPLAPDDRAPADASLDALLRRVRAERPAEAAPARETAPPAPPVATAPPSAAPEPARVLPLPAPARRESVWRHAAWLVPAAAAAAVAVVLFQKPVESPIAPAPAPAPAPPAPQPQATRPVAPTPGAGPASLRLERYSGVRAADGAWHTGDAFELRFELPVSSYVVVWHVGPDGEASLLFPPAGAARVPRFGAGEVVLPPVSAPERWVFEGEPGPETFVVGTREQGEVGLPALAAAVESALAGITDRTARVLLIETVLREQFGEVGRVEAEHRP